MRSLFFVLTLTPSLALAWGFDGHRKLASLMQDAMPAGHCLRTWFTARQTTARQDDACDPDRWKEDDFTKPDDQKEWPRHFLSIDYATPITSYPRDFAAVQAWRPQYAYANGTVPWHIETRYAQLVEAFRAQNESEILTQAFVLSHYAADTMSVLHNTRYFDPNTRPDGGDGLHWRWESEMFFDNTRVNGIATEAQLYLGSAGVADPRNNTFDFVLVGNAVAADLVATDNASDGTATGLYQQSKELTARRWADAIVFQSSLLWSAWNDAGRPELNGFSSTCSRAAPVGDPVVNGYPPPGGFTHDADGGVGGGAGGGNGSSGGGAGGGAPVAGGVGATGGGPWWLGGGTGNTGGGGTEPDGCGCTHAPGAMLVLLGFATLLRRRR